MKKVSQKTFYLALGFLQILLLISVAYPHANDIHYANTLGRDFIIDAPWFIQDISEEIPVQFVIRDAHILPLPALKGLFIEIPGSHSGHDFSETDTIFSRVYSPQIINLNVSYWDTLVFLDVPAGYSPGDVVYLRCLFHINTGISWDTHFSQILAVQIGTSPIPRFSGWYIGDVHFHTSFTNNPYEYGGTFEMLYHCSKAMGIDFITTTDHASDSSVMFGMVAEDLTQSHWEKIPDSIETYGTGNPLIIRGEEADVSTFTTSRNHFLIIGNEEFFPAPVFDIYAIKTHIDLYDFLETEPEAVGYAAHPYNDFFVWPDYAVNQGVNRGVFHGLQIWNGRDVWKVNVHSDDNRNPFPFSDGDMTGSGGQWDDKLKIGLEKWDSFLRQYLSEAGSSEPKKLFIAGGSDAHGDFNYFTHLPMVSGIPTVTVHASDNAFAKVRTVAYCPDGLSREAVLHALRNGRTIITDGPVVEFYSQRRTSGATVVTRIGETDTVLFDGSDSLYIRYLNTIDFGGEIVSMSLIRAYGTTIDTIRLDDHTGGLAGRITIPLDIPIEEGWCYYRLEAATFHEGEQYINPEESFRCFTNPIWFYVQNEAHQIQESMTLNFDISPNPFREKLEISGDFTDIEILDILGRSLYSGRFSGRGEVFVWTMDDDIQSGVFLVRVRIRGQIVEKRVVHIK